MDITISKTISETVTLSDANVKEITRQSLKRMLDPGEYIEANPHKANKPWLAKDDAYRGEVVTRYLRPASRDEIAIYAVLCLVG